MMSFSTVVFTAITIFTVVMSLSCMVMAVGAKNAEAGGSSDYIPSHEVSYFLHPKFTQPEVLSVDC